MTNSPSQEWKKCEKNAQTELVQIGEVPVGMYEIIGGRAAQEDVLIAFSLPEFRLLANAERYSVLQKTIAIMQDQYGNVQEQGSTLTGTLCWKENQTIKTYTANVGDSTAFLLVLDKDKKLKSIKRLNTELHQPSTESERERVGDEHVSMGRLAGVLALTRAIGDTAFEANNLSHEPAIEIDETHLEVGDRAYIIVACDGLTEGIKGILEGLYPQEIGALVRRYADKTPDQIAKLLVVEALKMETDLSGEPRRKHASMDNISVAVAPILSERAFGIFVFDGHGGKKVSTALGENFFTTLKQETIKKLDKS